MDSKEPEASQGRHADADSGAALMKARSFMKGSAAVLAGGDSGERNGVVDGSEKECAEAGVDEHMATVMTTGGTHEGKQGGSETGC